MQIFPYLLTRIGGGSFDHLSQVDYTQLIELADSLTTLNATKKQLKRQLCERLLACITALPDPKIQNKLQNLRRDIFNERQIKQQALLLAKQHLPRELTCELDKYLAFEDDLIAALENAEANYSYNVQVGRQHLQQLSRDEYLQKGLVLSSQSLLNALPDYSRQHPASFRKKQLQTEQSLLKYLTRMYTKTSPFSTFNNLALGTFGSLPGEIIQIAAAPQTLNPVRGHIRLNNQLFRYLKDLFTASREVYQHLLLRANPTIQDKGDHYVYLTNHNNVEAFQRIPANPVVDRLWQLVRGHQAGIRFARLVEQAGEFIDAPAENIEQYTRQLIGYGFLEYDLGVAGTDPDWDLKLVDQLQYLEQQQVAHSGELIRTLKHIRTRARQYALAPVTGRQQILNEMYHCFRATCMQLHEAAGLPDTERKAPEALATEWRTKQKELQRRHNEKNRNSEQVILVAEEEALEQPEVRATAFEHKSNTFFSFKPEQMLYEDTVREVSVQLDEEQLKQLVQILFTLLRELRLFRGLSDEREQMRHYFLQKYGHQARVSLLNFYEDFYREIKKPEAERQAQKRKESSLKTPAAPGNIPAAVAGGKESLEPKTWKKLAGNSPANGNPRQQWMSTLVAGLPDAPTLKSGQADLPLSLLRQINKELPVANQEPMPANSFGAFIQLYREKDETGEWQLKGVLNGTSAGYGKFLSRFLHIFPEEVTRKVREWNMDLQEDSLFLEDCDASYFNANLHPPLMPFEIRTPGGHNGVPVKQQLPISDFEVCVHAAAGELQLFHKPTAKRGFVFDLGFQGQASRSPLFQLLDKFTQAEYLSPSPVITAVNTAAEQKNAALASNIAAGQPAPKQISVRPRIVFENRLVIQRKGWSVPKDLVPLRQPGLSDCGYYCSLNEWRKSQDIPDEIYITINPYRHQPNRDPAKGKTGRDDYKPQYINFNDPLLVLLFEKLAAKVPETLKIEEMLPHSKQLLQISNQRFVTEFVVQWYSQKNNPSCNSTD